LTNHLAEYQGSQNKNHKHNLKLDFNDGAVILRIPTNYGVSGIFGRSQVSGATYVGETSGNTVSAYRVFLNMNKAVESEGATAKPPTVAIMWILRFI